ncbi:MAG: DUF3842 family protein [Eubacteriaceae bacterium]|jgi:NAD(P)-dependent dehydrogenase (short-subunit alcohol dehydrogenase family)|nr:DUF3842 family protein [Eubacteriaceae bacterium]
MVIAVIDGQGGGIGRSIVEKLRAADIKNAEIMALGTNATATGIMMKAGADEGATGENAIVYNMQYADVIVGVVGILTANAMMGELTPAMATAIGASNAFKVLLPLNRCGIHMVGLADMPMGRHIDEAVDVIRDYIKESSK